MAISRGSVHHALATPVELHVRPITAGLIALVAAVAVALAIALAASGGGGAEDSGFTKSVRVAPAGQYVPSQAERNQPPGLNGPGLRP